MRATALALAGLLLAGSGLSAPVARAEGDPSEVHPGKDPTVTAQRVIGRSVRGRPIRAYRLGEPGGRTALLIATMHGNEQAPRQILRSLTQGPPLHGLTLWVVPVYNPDGLAAGTRKNAHGVDLNRNFPYHWVDLDGSYESGPKPASEPETRAMMRFLRRIKPWRIVSFHQPLYGVDTDTKTPAFARRLAKALQLPRKSFTCGGVCHGTMTGWYNHGFRGSAVTVEYGAKVRRSRLRVQAPRALVRVLGGWRGHRGWGSAG